MREFKFIRSKYTNENVFNSDETKACLFAYDKNGELVQFTVKNNEEFQDKFAELSSDRLSKIYTLRPSQFTVSAKQEGSGFDFEYEADKIAFNDDEQIPEIVRNNAESYIKSNTEVTFDTGDKHLPILNFENNGGMVKTPTIFNLSNGKEFSKNLIFKITGKVKEIGYTTAQGESITAYPKSDGKIDFGGEDGTNAISGTFYQGILQKIATTRTGTIIKNTEVVSTSGNLPLAKNYTVSDGFVFIEGDQFETNIPYQDGLSFKLYSEVSGYLTAANASDAATSTSTFNSNVDKYKINSAGDYELYSSANANDDVTYYLIQEGSSASSTKLREIPNTSYQKYSVISGDDYYFVDSKESRRFTALGFKSVTEYIDNEDAEVTSLQETKTVGDGKVAFIKVNDIWQAINSNDTITSKLFTTVSTDDGNEKVYLSSIKRVTSDTYLLNGSISITRESFSNVIGIEYYYNETLIDEYREFPATAASQAMFIKFSSLESIIASSGTNGIDYGNIYTPVEATKTTTYSLKTNYVAYNTTEELIELLDGSGNKVYKRDETKEASITSFGYNFYYVNIGTAYMLEGECRVPNNLRQSNQFVEGYAASYNSYYIFKNNNFSNISAEDLTGETITYYESNDHHIIGNGVYDNDDDGKNYVMFSEDWAEDDINSDNVLVNEDNVPSPNTTESVLRFIIDVEVNATQSD